MPPSETSPILQSCHPHLGLENSQLSSLLLYHLLRSLHDLMMSTLNKPTSTCFHTISRIHYPLYFHKCYLTLRLSCQCFGLILSHLCTSTWEIFNCSSLLMWFPLHNKSTKLPTSAENGLPYNSYGFKEKPFSLKWLKILCSNQAKVATFAYNKKPLPVNGYRDTCKVL